MHILMRIRENWRRRDPRVLRALPRIRVWVHSVHKKQSEVVHFMQMRISRMPALPF